MGTAESFYTRTTRFSGIKSAARILGVVGANLTMVQAASIVFDNQYAVLNEDYILRVYGQEVYSSYPSLSRSGWLRTAKITQARK